MDLGDCYRLLGLRSGASFTDIKASYRRLVRQYHPDINPDDNKAKEKFIALTEAYKFLLTVVPQEQIVTQQPSQPQSVGRQKTRQDTKVKRHHQPPAKKAVPQQKPTPHPPKPSAQPQPQPQPQPPGNLPEIEKRLKWKTYDQLQGFLKAKRFPQAIALVEALAERLPQDVEVRQWQAIAYQLWGRALISDKQLLKARIYLKKALKTDPNNKSLLHEVQQDFQLLEQIF